MFLSGLWSQSRSNLGWVEPEPEIWVPILEIVSGASDLQK